MAYSISCPKCGNTFDPGESIQKKLNADAAEWRRAREEEYRKKESEFHQQYEAKENAARKQFQVEKDQLQEQLRQTLRKDIASDYENQLKLLQQSLVDNEEKLRGARAKELEYLQKEMELKNREAELDIAVQKRLAEERGVLSEQLRKEELQRNQLKDTEHQLRLRELEKQLEDQKKLTEEMLRKAEQGSMQLQGEVQELLLEQILRSCFPFDEIKEVGKGVRGADCIQTVRNTVGHPCGQIIYESKRTLSFSNDWIEKLRADMRSLGADVAVIVTQALPKEMDRFGERDGVYICTFSEVGSLATVLRNGLLRVSDLRRSQDNKGDKMSMLYDYLTSGEFSEQWRAIREGFLSMKTSIQREREQMEKLWKAREKSLEKVLINAARIKGSVEGIAGNDAVNLNLLEEGDEEDS